LLIDGIINPIPIAIAIDALDFEILSYDETLVEENEINLISELQQWIYRFVHRWNNDKFSVSDELYAASFIGVLATQLVPVLLNLRLRNCKTERVHSYHVWNYLGGYFELDKFKVGLTINQALFFYRNMEYLIGNRGSCRVLDFLNINIVIPSNLTLRKFIIVQGNEQLLENVNTEEFSLPQGDVIVAKLPYLSEYSPTNTIAELSLEEFINLYSENAVNNAKLASEEIKTIKTRLLSTTKKVIPSSLLELSSVETSSDTTIDDDVEKINNWFYAASNNKIRFNYNLTVVNGTIRNKVLTPKDSAILLMALFSLLSGGDLNSIKVPWAYGILINPNLVTSDYEKIIENKYRIIEYKLSNGNIETIDRINELSSLFIYQPIFYNTLAFSEYVTAVVQKKIRHYLLQSLENDSLGKQQLQTLIETHYINYRCANLTPANYDDFFDRIGFDLRTLSDDILEEILNQLLSNYIGIGSGINSNDRLNNMVNILNLLTSYMTTFVKGENKTFVTPVKLPSLCCTFTF
jgi:hypothetical protein